MKTYLSIFAIVFAINSISFASNPIDGLPENVVKKHLALTDNDCSVDHPDASQIFNISETTKLYLVPCYLAAYQGTSRAYIAQGESVEPVMVLAYDETVKAVVASLDLMDAQYDSASQELTTYAKGRGIGDCGQSSVTRIAKSPYGNVAVKTVEIRAKIKCDGKMTTWPIVFKQK